MHEFKKVLLQRQSEKRNALVADLHVFVSRFLIREQSVIRISLDKALIGPYFLGWP